MALESIPASASALWHAVPPAVLLWLAVFFGRTLRAGNVPLIERIARVSKPDLNQALCRYTRKLTMAWCVYFLLAALLSLSKALSFGWTSVLIGAGSLLFFVGERMIRPHLYPDQVFPGLWQQVQDTYRVWRPGL